jgi:hypothetical protein
MKIMASEINLNTLLRGPTEPLAGFSFLFRSFFLPYRAVAYRS